MAGIKIQLKGWEMQSMKYHRKSYKKPSTGKQKNQKCIVISPAFIQPEEESKENGDKGIFK